MINFVRIIAFILICSKVSSNPIESSTPTILENKSNNASVKISNFYVTTSGIGSHKLNVNAKSWEDARVTCLNEGAHLAVIKSAAEEALIVKKMVELKFDEVWLGIHELFKKDDWVTVQDQRLDSLGFVHWRNGEPNNFQDKSEHCVTITQAGLNDLNCATAKPFLCKIG